jgi:ADP-ribosylglycohydrolase
LPKEKDLLVQKWSHFDLNTNLKTLSNEQSKISLFVNYAVPFAIKCFHQTNSYEECMREILSHFGDTDTICAIAGGLCYAYYGETEFNTNTTLMTSSLASSEGSIPIFTNG